jgi:competence protein ComEA
MAERIIEYRTSNRFKKKEDIKSVKGIGEGIFEKIKDDITC